MNRSLVVLAVAGAAALALAGCTGSPEAETPQPQDSPLSKIMSAAYGFTGDEDAMQEKFQAQQKEAEEFVAQCMSEEGFEYIPNAQSYSYYSGGDEWNPESREWVAQYGYGALNFPGRDEQPDMEDMPEDPNQEYVMSLSMSEQEAYYAALYGPGPDESEMNEDGSYEWRWEDGGCYGWAQHEVTGEQLWESEEHKPLFDAINKFYETAQTAPGLDELNAAWSSCMADAGYPGFAAQPDAAQSIYDELNEYYESQTEWIENDPELAALGESEIEIALADLDCREEHDYRAKAMTVQWELEEQFIAEHKAELDALVAAAEVNG